MQVDTHVLAAGSIRVMRSNSSFKAYRDSTVKMRAARALILLVGAVMALWGVQGSKKPPDPPTGRSVRMGRTTEPAATADAAVGPCRRNKPQRTASSRRQQGGTQTQERWGPRADAWRPQPSEHHPLQQQPSSPETYTTAAAAGGGPEEGHSHSRSMAAQGARDGFGH